MANLVLDISKYDSGIDLEEWKRRRGLWGVIIKFGGNERAVGGRYRDYLSDEHYNKAKKAGLHIGAYYYTDTTDIATAQGDAYHFASILDEFDFDLPCYIDVEDPNQFNLPKRTLTDLIKVFCDTLISRGYYAGLYTNGSAWLNNMYSSELDKYANWIALWGPEWPQKAGDIGMWQQGGMNIDGNIVFDDVPGYHDLDWCCVDYPSRIKNGSKEQDSVVIPEQHSGNPLNDCGFGYKAHCQNVGWLPAVRDGQIAGTTGYSARLEALKFRPTKEMGKLNVSLHMQGIGWKDYIGIQQGDNPEFDPICGTVGEERRVEAFKLELDGNTTGKKLRYCAHIQSIGWTDPVWEGTVCGTTGEKKRIEAVRIWLDDPNNPIDIHDHSEEVPSPVIEPSYGQAHNVIDAAYGELGYYAPDDPERGSKYGRWLADLTGEDWLAGPSNEIFWCCMFASWCLDQGGVQMDGFPTQNTDLALNGGAKKYAIPIEDVDYGDIVIFNWDWNNTTDHIGFATGPYDGYGFPTIEGNVGNAVKEKYRQLGNVAYVLRPPYKEGGSGSHNPSVPAEPKNNRDGGKLEVDGIGGWNTIIDWQNQLHVIEDGRISGQDKNNYEYFRGIVTVDFDGTGSKTVMTIQSIVGANVDGIWGKDTSTKIQEWLVNKGYPCTVDGYFGTNSVMALQQSLNDGMWKLY